MILYSGEAYVAPRYEIGLLEQRRQALGRKMLFSHRKIAEEVGLVFSVLASTWFALVRWNRECEKLWWKVGMLEGKEEAEEVEICSSLSEQKLHNS